MHVERLRWLAVLAFVVASALGMGVAVAYDVPCALDCPPDDDVTWRDALFGGGTGLSPPASFPILVALLSWAANRRDRWGPLSLIHI